ncbi:MAG: acyltransferase family protein [Porphyromonas sp.]
MTAGKESSTLRTSSASIDSAVLRGVAISSIALHNYCHWMKGAIFENEFTYQAWHVSKLVRYLAHPDERLPLQLLSFFGHYGVVLFVFLSAYGLEKKYGQSGDKVPALPFIWKHYLKLLSMLLAGNIAFYLLNLRLHIFEFSWDFVQDALIQLVMVSNITGEIFRPGFLGPYWYFGLTLQLYVLYRLLLFRKHWAVCIGFMLLSWYVQTICDPAGEAIHYLKINSIGHIFTFGLGILYARYGRELSKSSYTVICLLSGVLIWFTGLWFQSWLWTPLFVCTFGLSLIKLFPAWLNKGFTWIGGISAALFVSHPLVREICVDLNKEHGLGAYTGLLIYIVTALLVAIVFQKIIDRVSPYIMKLAKH